MLAKDDPARVKLSEDRARHWLSVGAQPSDRVLRFLDAAGVLERAPRNNPKKGEPGEAARERAEDKVAKLAATQEAAKVDEEEAKAPLAETPADELIAEEVLTEEDDTEEAPEVK